MERRVNKPDKSSKPSDKVNLVKGPSHWMSTQVSRGASELKMDMSTIKTAHNTPVNASIWIIAVFTVERIVATPSLQLKVRMHTTRNAGLCCVAVLAIACVKNIDIVLMSNIIPNTSGDVTCYIPSHYMDYIIHHRPSGAYLGGGIWLNFFPVFFRCAAT